jgi:phosphate transport system substrate-binding protein
MGQVTIGASDLFLSEKELKREDNIVLVPVALAGTVPIVNLPSKGIHPLKMDGPVLAEIFSGKIRFWDDPTLTSLNRGWALPHLPIRVYHRSDSSGTSFILTDYLARTSALWRDRIGRETHPDWPEFAESRGVSGSGAMVRAVRNHAGAIGYVGLGWAQKSALSIVALKNREGRFVAGSVQSVGAAGQAAFSDPDFPSGFNRSIVWNIKGRNAYPASSVEFWLISPDLPGPTMEKVRSLLAWVLTEGQGPDYTIRNGFVPLPGAPGNPRLGRRLLELLPGNTYRPVSGG